jgi:hypothetical protein
MTCRALILLRSLINAPNKNSASPNYSIDLAIKSILKEHTTK